MNVDQIKKCLIASDEFVKTPLESLQTLDSWKIDVLRQELGEHKSDVETYILSVRGELRESITKGGEQVSETALKNICEEQTREELKLLNKIKNMRALLNNKKQLLMGDAFGKGF